MNNAVTKIEDPEVPQTVTPTMQMLQLAVEKDFDIEKLTKLMDLNNQHEAHQAKKAFAAAMAAFSEVAPTLKKTIAVDYTSKNSGQRTQYNHEDLAKVIAQVRPLTGPLGLYFNWKPTQVSKGSVTVICVLTHKDGHFTETPLTADADNSGGKNAIQSLGSSLTYLKRYTLELALGLAAEDDDDDGNGFGGSDGPINGIQKKEIINKLKKIEELGISGGTTKDLLFFLKAESVDVIPAKDFKKAMNALNAKVSK